MVVGAGLISLKSYFIPKSLAESVSKKGIRLTITAYEARSKYSYAKMRSVVTIFKFMPKYTVEHRVFYDRFHTLRYNITRNRLRSRNCVSFWNSPFDFRIQGNLVNLSNNHAGDSFTYHSRILDGSIVST